MQDVWILGTSTGWPQRRPKCGMCSPSVGVRSGCWWKGIGKWSMKAGSATNLLSSRIQSGRPLPCRSCDSHGDFGSEAVWCRPESRSLPSTSSYCSIRGFRDSRRTYISDNPQCGDLGRLDACHFQVGRSRNKLGPAVGAPRRRARFDVVILRLYRASRRRRVDVCVTTRRVLLRRKHRLLPRTPVHKRAPRLSRQRPDLTGMARGRARGKTGVCARASQTKYQL